jgi:UDP-glucose 4-epimerase
MRVALLGGTQFIGRTIVEELVAAEHQVLVIHRGENEPPDLPAVQHLHVDRRALLDRGDEIAAFGPKAFIDTKALTGADAEMALEVIPHGAQAVVLSSTDVYRAYDGLHLGVAVDPVPLTEESPVRDHRYPYRGKLEGMEDYEKLDVEEV